MIMSFFVDSFIHVGFFVPMACNIWVVYYPMYIVLTNGSSVFLDIYTYSIALETKNIEGLPQHVKTLSLSFTHRTNLCRCAQAHVCFFTSSFPPTQKILRVCAYTCTQSMDAYLRIFYKKFNSLSRTNVIFSIK